MRKHRQHIASTLGITLGLLSTTGASAETVVRKGEIRVEDHVYQILDKDLTSIKFMDGSSVLADSDVSALSTFVKNTADEAKVERYLVAAWADKDYPGQGELSKGQRKLAELRAKHIKAVLTTAGASKVDTFEMTKQPNWIQRAFSTETAEVKNKGSSITFNQRLLKEIGTRLHDRGGPNMAVIVAKFNNEVAVK